MSDGAAPAQLPAPPPEPGTAGAAAQDKPPRAKRKSESGAEKRAKAKAKAAAASSAAKPPSAGAALNAEVRKIEEQLTALFVGPSVPMRMAGDDWPADHVESKGPDLAHQIAELARRNPAVRSQLRAALSVNENAQLGFAVAAYLAPILIYYGLLPAPPMIKEQLQVPDRAAARAGVVPDWSPTPDVSSERGSSQTRPGPFAEQPPGTPGSPPAPAPGAASPNG